MMNGGTTWSAASYDSDAYTVKQDNNGTINFILGSEGYDKMVQDINRAGNTPIFI